MEWKGGPSAGKRYMVSIPCSLYGMSVSASYPNRGDLSNSTLPRPCAGTSAQAPEKEKLLYIQRESHCSLATPLAFGGYFLVKVNVSGRNYAPPTPALSPLLLGKQAQPGFISGTSGRESFLMCYREIPALSLLAAFVLLIRSLCPNFVSCSSCTATSNTFES